MSYTSKIRYLCARVSVIFQVFLHHFVLTKLATINITVTDIEVPMNEYLFIITSFVAGNLKIDLS